MRLKTILTVTAIGGFLMAASCASSGAAGAPRNLYKTEKGRNTAYESYDRAMKLWPVPFADEWVDTDFGKTHIVKAGPENGQPLFLIPGLFADATMWYANVGALSERYRVYALDMVNYGGKSEPEGKAIAGIEDYVAWFGAIMEHYGCRRVAVAGLSYGSWLSLALAREKPEWIAAVAILDPAETFMAMDGGIAWKGFWSFAFFPNRKKYTKFFDWMGGGYTDPKMEIWFEHMLDVIEFGNARYDRVPPCRIYGKEDLTRVNMPVLVLSGGKPILYKDPAKFASSAAEALPDAIIDVVPDSGHGLNMEKPDYVNERMISFLKERYL